MLFFFQRKQLFGQVNFFDEFHFDKVLFRLIRFRWSFDTTKYCFEEIFSTNFFRSIFFDEFFSINSVDEKRVQIWTIRRKVKKGLTRFWRKNLILFYIFILCSLSNTLVNGKESHDKEISSQVISIKEREKNCSLSAVDILPQEELYYVNAKSIRLFNHFENWMCTVKCSELKI
jgi:hypothetical protein